MVKTAWRILARAMKTKSLAVNPRNIRFIGDNPIISDDVSRKNLEEAAQTVRQSGQVVAFPTETVYGLGGSALSDDSVLAIYAAKNRPADNPLIVHVSSLDQIERLILTKLKKLPIVYEKLVETFWPGPLTILLPVEEGSLVLKLCTAGQDTVGVRMPKHPVARALIAMSDTPLAAPSANASTRPSPTEAGHVMFDLDGRIPCIIDGGPCEVGVELTVVDGLSEPPMLLRPGGVSAEAIKQCGGGNWENVVLAKKTAGKMEAVKTPGMKYRHYLPTAKVVLFVGCGNGEKSVKEWVSRNSISDFSKVAVLRGPLFASAEELGLSGAVERDFGHTATEMAFRLFKLLREVDDLGVDVILVEGVAEEGDGLAVMNRLSKAAFEIVSS